MINSEAFAKRLQRVMDYYSESASSFAEKIGVQRSSISHILSGRNKPSLEFVLKIISHYPEVGLYWLLNGKGEFPQKKDSATNAPEVSPEPTIPEKETPHQKHRQSPKSIERIVIFYNDGSYKNYTND